MMYNESCAINSDDVLELLPSLIRCREHAEQIAQRRRTKPCQLQSGIFLLSETLRRLHDKLEAKEFSSSAPYKHHEQDYLAWYLKNAHDRGEHAAEIDPLCATCTAAEST